MANLGLSFLPPSDIQMMHDTTIRILERIGVRIDSQEVLDLIEGRDGINVDQDTRVVTFREEAVMEAIDLVPPTFSVYGRDRSRKITYGQEGFVCQAIPGETHWVNPRTHERRSGTFDDFERCVVVADALPNIDIVGAMIQPDEIPVEIRDLVLYAELFKRSKKPVRSWVQSRIVGRYLVEMLNLIAGNSSQLKNYPLVEFGFEPVSPLQLPGEPLEIALDFARAGMPITIGPMTQAMGTGPVTLAGNVTLANAESLATLVAVQIAAPGNAMIYYSAPHIMDPRTMNLVFSSPEQGLMAVMVTQLGKYYGLPVGINVGLTDAKIPDAQAGMEKGMTMLIGAMAGADIFGAMGIAGCDQGFSLPQLVIDDEIIGFVKRMMRGVRVNEETLAYEVIERVGIGETFLMEDHTLDHWRDEFWIPELCDRDSWEPWIEQGGKSMLDRAVERQQQILNEHELEWLEEDLQSELDSIVASAKQEIFG